MKIISLQDAERSADFDVKLVTVRASGYRVFGSKQRIPDGDMAVVDLRGSTRPEDFDTRFRILDKHPVQPIMLVQKLS
jgi:hypothetical protein